MGANHEADDALARQRPDPEAQPNPRLGLGDHSTRNTLEGRLAFCTYGTPHAPRLSIEHDNLFLFEYLGEGSRQATESCTCGFYVTAHAPYMDHPMTRGHAFQARGPHPTDRYYDGCRGWD